MDAWELDALDSDRALDDRSFYEFLSVPDLSAGKYVLEEGAEDLQTPHTEDELYHVVAGHGAVTVGAETRRVAPGSLIFVAARVPHRFHDISERLALLVMFGPAESSRAGGAPSPG